MRAQEDFAKLIVPEPDIEEGSVVSQPLPIKPTQPKEDSEDVELGVRGTGTTTQESRPNASAARIPTGRSGSSSEAGAAGSSSSPSEDVASQGVLALLSTTGSSDREERVADILGEKAIGDQDFDKIFNNIDRLGREGKVVGSKEQTAEREKQTRGSRTTTDENIDQLVSGLGTAKSTSLARSNDLVSLELSPLTHAGDEEGEGGAIMVGARDPEQVSKIVNAHKAALQYCYERELKLNPHLRGKVSIRFSITPNGAVKDAKILSSTLDSEHVERCILSRIRRWSDFGQIDPALGDATFRQVYSFGY